MEIRFIPIWIFFAEIVASILLIGFVIYLGKQLTKPGRRFFGTASPDRTYFETGFLNLACLIPNLLLITLTAIYNLPSEWMIVISVLSAVLFGLSFVVLPLWAAMRLAPPERTEPKAYVIRYFHILIGLSLVVLATSGSAFILLPALMFQLFIPGTNYLPLSDLFPLTIIVAFEFTVVFLLLRGLMELTRFVLSRNHKPVVTPIIQPPQKRQYYSHLLLSISIVFVLVMWVMAYILYINYDKHPGWVYVPPIFSDSPISSSQVSPFESPSPVMATAAVPSLMILLVGLFISRRTLHINEQVSSVFGVLCLLYGLWGLEIFPRLGGSVFWALRLLAWLFITPVQLHFALVFPYEDESIAGEMRPTWVWVKRSLYIGFALFSPVWLFFYFNTYQENLGLMQERGYLIPLWALWGIFGTLSLISTWLLSAYILWHTWRGLGHELDNPPAVGESSGCQWLDILKGRDQLASQILHGKQQLSWVLLGAFLAAVIFIIWLLLITPVTTSGSARLILLSDIVVKSGFLMIFLGVFLAIMKYRLWDIDRIAVDAFLWSLFVAAMSVISVILESSLEGYLASTLGIVAFFIMAKISLDDWLSPWAYRYFWQSHYRWQQNLKAIVRQMSDSQKWPFTNQNAKILLNAACPAKASAAWLLVSTGNPINRKYRIHEIHHAMDCQGLCIETFKECLGWSKKSSLITVTGSLYGRLVKAISGNVIEVLLVDKLAKDVMLDLSGLHGSDEKGGDEEKIVSRLQAAKLALIVPFGSNDRLKGILLIATDGRGDYYDRHDLYALSNFANQFSIWLN